MEFDILLSSSRAGRWPAAGAFASGLMEGWPTSGDNLKLGVLSQRPASIRFALLLLTPCSNLLPRIGVLPVGLDRTSAEPTFQVAPRFHYVIGTSLLTANKSATPQVCHLEGKNRGDKAAS